MTRNKKKIQKKKWLLFGVACLLLTGCGSVGHAHESTFESAYENGTEEEPVDIYVSTATVIFKGADKEDKTLQLYMIDKKEDRTFSYDGATKILDAYGASMSVEQLVVGNILNISYNSELQKAGSVQLSPDAFHCSDMEKYVFDTHSRSVTVGGELYQLDANVQIFSENELITEDQIVSQDVLSFYGIGRDIMSITVEKGHGYLELTQEDLFVGGWIEIGQTIISQIAQDMLFTVPEGTYQVQLTAAGLKETRDVTISRNAITKIDLGDVEKPVPESGKVAFYVVPEDAEVYVDEKRIDPDYMLKLPLGIHQITASASGYDTVSEYFDVDGEYVTVRLELTKPSESVSGNDVSWAADTKEENGTITIQLPSQVEVYEDNLYKGYTPLTYTKTAGTHVITLRKTGYITKSYTIEVPDDDENLIYSFPDLEPEQTTSKTVSGNSVSRTTDSGKSDSGKTVSGNSVSGNSVSGNSAS